MNFLFTPNHVQLLNSCFPPTSALLTAGPEYSPNSQELSRLTYYASNHPDKIAKLGTELDKRLRAECKKAQAGNLRARANLLITLAIFRSLATECRRDLNLLSVSLISSVETTLSTLPNDLEVSSRAASVFTTWTTYTDGHLIGTDNALTNSYISCLRSFAALSCSGAKDIEVRNRTRLIGFAALTGAINSEALYNDSAQFKTQAAILVRSILKTLLETELADLNKQAAGVKDAPASPYLAEFRTRPAMERRAASIHLHIDGENGPTMSEVSSAALRALFSLLENVNGVQLGRVIRSGLDNMAELKAWSQPAHCCWFAHRAAEWSQYQYRYVIPTWTIDRLVESQDATNDMQKVLASMATTVFNSSVPMVNLSTSDILSSLMTLVVRKVTSDPNDELLPSLVECISSLGSHVYYSDQIQDLVGEMITRITPIETHGVLPQSHSAYDQSRTQVIRSLLLGLLGIMHAANKNEPDDFSDDGKPCDGATHKDTGLHDRSSRRSRVLPEMWHETLSLLCDESFAVRADYADTIAYYLAEEMPKHGDYNQNSIHKEPPTEGSVEHIIFVNSLLSAGDPGGKLLHAVHSYIYILLASSSLQPNAFTSSSNSPNINIPSLNIEPATPLTESHPDIRYLSASPGNTPRSRKLAMAFRLLQSCSGLQESTTASLLEYSNALAVITTIHEQLPIRGLITGIPMLLALDGACDLRAIDARANPRICGIKIMLAHVWAALGKVWRSPELTAMAEKALSSLSSPSPFSSTTVTTPGKYHPSREPVELPSITIPEEWSGVDSEKALQLLIASPNVQQSTGLKEADLLARFSRKWTAESAMKESIEKPASFEATLRGDGVSPLIKITPGLMTIDNRSLASLARSTRGVGVTELREALEGRSSMSNPALARPGSISTLDHASSILGSDIKLSKTRSRTRGKRTVPATGEVRDVLNKLGLGKQNGSLLKSSFPTLQQRS